MAEIEVDATALVKMAKDIQAAKKRLLGRLGERGYQLLRDEVPFDSGNLKQGVAPPEIDHDEGTALLVVSARSAARGARKATLHLKGERTKEITLRPTSAYNYAEVIARGNKDAVLVPKKARAFLIPVKQAPADGNYITSGDEMFVVRRTRKGTMPNPYDERAARRLEGEVPKIWGGVFREFFQ